jgi:DNA-binding NarL/FixJ family response regulator
VSAKTDPPNGRAAGRRRAAKAQDGPLVALLGGVGALATEALTWMLTESGCRVLGIYGTPRELREDLDAGAGEARVLLIDADDPAYSIAVLAEVKRRHPKLRILLLCETVTPAIVHGAIAEQVEGLVLKSDSVEEVITAFHHVLEGRSVMPCGWQEVSLEPTGASPLDALSVREREVLELAVGGMRNREIAERLMISSNTVKFHLRAIYSHLGVHSRIQAAHAVESERDRPLVPLED